MYFSVVFLDLSPVRLAHLGPAGERLNGLGWLSLGDCPRVTVPGWLSPGDCPWVTLSLVMSEIPFDMLLLNYCYQSLFPAASRFPVRTERVRTTVSSWERRAKTKRQTVFVTRYCKRRDRGWGRDCWWIDQYLLKGDCVTICWSFMDRYPRSTTRHPLR